MNKPAIKKAEAKQIEVAFVDLAINYAMGYNSETIKNLNRKADLLMAMSEALLQRGEDGIAVIERLAEHPTPIVRLCSIRPLMKINEARGLDSLETLAVNSDHVVAVLAQQALSFYKR